MKQIIQNLKTGETILENVPAPVVKRGHVLIRTHRTLVSLGTERMLVEFGKANLFAKARQQPDRVKMVLDKIKSDGLIPTLETVFKKLDEPLPLGYCNAGEVIAVGEDVESFKIGDRVASNGNHAEIVSIPKNLVARIPDNVTDEEASFTVIGAIGLQGIRLLNPTFGETIVVIGLGLIGLITGQLLRANGCRVIGLDFDESKVTLARELGMESINVAGDANSVETIMQRTLGIGADGVVITASSKSDDIISQAAQMSRKRGRIVLVGVIGLDIRRSDFFEKELTFQVSCSYGPGRYDEAYEQKGIDYPLPFVRWTEKRNFEAVLQAISERTLNVNKLISEVVELDNYNTIYGEISKSRSIASLIKFPSTTAEPERKVQVGGSATYTPGRPVIGIIGAGNFTKMMIVPILRKLNAQIKYIASDKGLTGTMLAKKYKIGYSTTDYREILSDPEVNTVLITVRHNLHAKLCLEAIQAGKNVFVEKPLALNREELDLIKSALGKFPASSLTVGFNRRFSPFAVMAKELLRGSSPMQVICNMNAGAIPANSWVHDMQVGGGRIVGEACHLVDLITFFTGSLVDEVVMSALGTDPRENTDNASIIIKYKNGAQGIINYFSNGSKAYAKERVEIYSEGRTIVIDNYRKMKCYGFSKSGMSSSQDKGHKNQFDLFLKKIQQGDKTIIPVQEIMNTSYAALAAIDSLKSRQWVKVDD
jgi:predicted dehydrogenase/threonine dehydrogenase-like Zn-dependent dehydrogenase